MRADAAAVGGEADHQIIEPRVRDEAELAQQRVGAGVVQVDALHQQRPFLLLARGDGFERAGLHVPVAAAGRHQARLDVVVGGQFGQRLDAQQWFEAGDGLADHQGFFMPIIAQELRRRDVAEER